MKLIAKIVVMGTICCVLQASVCSHNAFGQLEKSLAENGSVEADSGKTPTDGQLGSSLTVDAYLAADGPKQPIEPRQLTVAPQGEPKPALRYRFWPHIGQLKPGNAYLHFARAITHKLLTSEASKKAWYELEMKQEKEDISAEEIEKVLRPFQDTINELLVMSECEDQSWDRRVRDMKGPEVYSYLLPEVQEVRSLARLLRFQAQAQLQRAEFDKAIDTIRCGYRLAAFTKNGETLVEQLVGLAIEGIMQDVVEQAIQTPGCPNLYWALATVPHDNQTLRVSIELEYSMAERLLPVFEEAKSAQWSQAAWKSKWEETLNDAKGFSGSGLGDLNIGLSLTMASQFPMDMTPIREKLVDFGIPMDKSENMAREQLMVLDASFTLRELGDRAGRAVYLPYHLSESVREGSDKISQTYETDNPLATILAKVLYPAFTQAIIAEERVVTWHNRLMTIEALRQYASEHNNTLPKTLDELDNLPAMPDTFTGQLIQYERLEEGNHTAAILTVQVPAISLSENSLRIQIKQ